jgi:DNA-binding MarR family transcriptional regulator
VGRRRFDDAAADEPEERPSHAPGRDELIDRMIVGVINWRRSPKVLRTQRDIYRAGNAELSPLQVDVLEYLCAHGKVRMGDLSKELRVDPASLSRAVARLVELELVARTSVGNDRRLVMVSPTAKGRRATAGIVNGRRELTRSLFAKLTDEEFALMVEQLEVYFSAYEVIDMAPQSFRRYEA